MAPKTSTPSLPRLIRPERSVRRSPRLTNRKGVLTARRRPGSRPGRSRRPRSPPGLPRPEPAEAAVEGLAGEDDDEEQALHDGDGRVRQAEATLEQAAAGRDAAEQDRHRHDGERV